MSNSKAFSEKISELELKYYKMLALIKWPDRSFKCRKCGCERYCKGKKPYSRKCMQKKTKAQDNCQYDESPTANTYFEKGSLPLSIKFLIIENLLFHSVTDSHIWREKTDLLGMNQKHLPGYFDFYIDYQDNELMDSLKENLVGRSNTLTDFRRRIQTAMGRAKGKLQGKIEFCVRHMPRFECYLFAAVEIDEEEYVDDHQYNSIELSNKKFIRKSAARIYDHGNIQSLKIFLSEFVELGTSVDFYDCSFKDDVEQLGLDVSFIDYNDEYDSRVYRLISNFSTWRSELSNNNKINRTTMELELNEFVFRCNAYVDNRDEIDKEGFALTYLRDRLVKVLMKDPNNV